MPDMSPFANNNSQSAIPDYLKPTANGGAGTAGAVNGVGNMVKALMAGDQKFRQQQGGAPGAAPQSTMAPGAPMSLAPPMPGPSADIAQDQAAGAAASMVGRPPMQPGMTPGMNNNPFVGGASPVTVDPVTQALMSPIPGM